MMFAPSRAAFLDGNGRLHQKLQAPTSRTPRRETFSSLPFHLMCAQELLPRKGTKREKTSPESERIDAIRSNTRVAQHCCGVRVFVALEADSRARAPRCSVFIATSLDGFIARRDGGIDWLSVVETPGEDYGYAKFFADVDALILAGGRTTRRWVSRVAIRRQALRRPDARIAREPARRALSRRCARPVAGGAARGGVRRVYVDGGAVIRLFLREA